MKTLLNIKFKYNEYDFDGILLYNVNPKKIKDWVNSMYKEGSENSKSLLKEFAKKDFLKNLHLYLSWFYILKLYLFVSALIALISIQYPVFSIVLMISSLIVIPLMIFFNHKMKDEYFGFNTTLMMIDMIFEMNKKEKTVK